MITLYGEPNLDSPFVFTTFVALKEKRVPFELRLVNLAAGEQKGGAYAEQSLTARVPSIEIDWFFLSESLAIVEYLDETLPAPKYTRLLPTDVQQRARARQVLGWLRSDLAALKKERPTDTFFFGKRAEKPLEPAARADADKLVRVASSLLGDRATLFDAWSIADADLSLALWRLVKNGDAVPESLRAYAETAWQRPSIAAWINLERPSRERVLGPF
jgi:glutathione S-transferase